MNILQARTLTLIVGSLLISACESKPPRMLGEHNVLIVADDALWSQIEDSTTSALKPNLIGLPGEHTYLIDHQSPEAVSDVDLQRYRQIVIFGQPTDSLAARVMDPEVQPEELPALFQRGNVWAEGQRVTIALLPKVGEVAGALDYIDPIADLIDQDYRNWTNWRMYGNGVDAEITDRLESQGVTLRVPNAYRMVHAQDSVFRMMTFGSDANPVTRSVTITWRTLSDSEPTPDSVLNWRQVVAEQLYEEDQDIQESSLQVNPLGATDGVLEVRAVWQGMMNGQFNAGPFVSRTVDCAEQDRRYFLDGWLFAPGQAKYPLLIQIEAVMDSFECGS